MKSVPSLHLLLLFFFCILIAKANSFNENRELTLEAPCNASRSDLLHIKSRGSQHDFHFLFASKGLPTVLTALTDVKSNVVVNCSTFNSSDNKGSIRFDSSPVYSFALVFTKLLRFYDPDDTADVSRVNSSLVTEIPLTNLEWNEALIEQNDSNKIDFTYAASLNASSSPLPLRIHFTSVASDSRSQQLPHLMRTINSTQIQIEVDDYPVNETKTRFALQFAMITIKDEKDFNFSTSRSLDDEFTPGVFELIQLQSSSIKTGQSGAYLQWKPISYTYHVASLENSSNVNPCCLMPSDLPNVTLATNLANAVYGSSFQNYSTLSFDVTLGRTGDNFYTKTNYSSWTFSVGYGIPPEDRISTLVIVVIAVGLGIPFLLLIVGGVYMLVKKYRSRSDDLLLND